MNFRFQISGFRFRLLDFGVKAQAAKPFYILLFTFCFLLCSCGLSVPNLEQSECVEARNTVREFYSYHFGNDMKLSPESLRYQEKFLSEELKQLLEQKPESAQDYFTQTDDYPKAFRIGACEAISPKKTIFEVLLFWKDDARSEQRAIKVEMIKQNGIWLINRVNL